MQKPVLVLPGTFISTVSARNLIATVKTGGVTLMKHYAEHTVPTRMTAKPSHVKTASADRLPARHYWEKNRL